MKYTDSEYCLFSRFYLLVCTGECVVKVNDELQLIETPLHQLRQFLLQLQRVTHLPKTRFFIYPLVSISTQSYLLIEKKIEKLQILFSFLYRVIP